MGSFVDAMLSMLFGWLQALINWIWGIIDSGGSALGTWFLQNWIPLTLVLIAGGLIVDWFIWLIRWRPYHVWGTHLRRIGRFFHRDQRQDTGSTPYAEEYAPEEAAYPDDASPEYLNTYQTEVYTPTSTQAPFTGDLPGDTYVESAAAPEEYMDSPDFYPEDAPPEAGAFAENPADISWTDWDSLAAADDNVWPPDGEMSAAPEEWDEIPLEPAYSAQDAEPFAYRELLPLDDEIDDTEREPLQEGEESLLDEAVEMEADEEMYDDFSNHGAPEPPQKRRSWEFSEEDAPATSRRRSTPDTEDTPPPRRNSRPATEDAVPRRRRDIVEEPAEAMDGIDPLAAYDAPEVMEQIQQPPRQGRTAASYPEETEGDAAPRRRRRSQRHRPEHTQEMPPEANTDAEYTEYPEEPPLDGYYDVEPEATPAPRKARSGRRGRSRTQARSQDYAEEYPNDFREEEPYNEEPYYEEDLPRNTYDEDAYFHDDPYADDLPDSPDWPHWEEEPELPGGQRNRGVTKPSLIDRLRGMASPSRTPPPEAEHYNDDEQPYYDDEIEDVQEVRPKKKGLFSKWLNPEQSEFQQPKPKPRVRQEDAYNEPVYPPKKRR